VIVTNANAGTVTSAGAFTYEAVPNPPGPPAQFAPSAPLGVMALPAVESAVVSWTEPGSPGTFPVTSYRVTASPGGRKCLVAAPALTCTITGLTPGKAYTFVARALNGAGWSQDSAPSEAVVPMAPETKSILITHSRSSSNPAVIRIAGSTTGLVGAEVTPHVRVAGRAKYVPGKNVRTVDAEGRFTWERTARKKLHVYFTSGDVKSNRLVIRPE
jgi:hypothetical protein